MGVAPWLGLTPNVVFCEGMKALGNDTFAIFYGGADSVVGVALVSVRTSFSELLTLLVFALLCNDRHSFVMVAHNLLTCSGLVVSFVTFLFQLR